MVDTSEGVGVAMGVEEDEGDGDVVDMELVDEAVTGLASEVFFFSSGRRHTRSLRDWSFRRVLFRSGRARNTAADRAASGAADRVRAAARGRLAARSEERRVGKECRSRGAPYQ